MTFWGFHIGWWALVALVMLLMVACHSFMAEQRRQRSGDAAIRILSERYAAGELTTEEYDVRRKRLMEAQDGVRSQADGHIRRT